MRKKLKAFTLIELIVTMLIMGIIMTGIMRMFDPINSVYTSTSVMSKQRDTEQGIANYIIENTRYAQSIGVYQKQSSAAEAMTAFLANHPTDLQGNPLDENDLDVICIINNKGYTLNNGTSTTYKGRLIRKISGQSACGETQPFAYDGTGSSYMAMGEAYYGPADYYIRIENFTSSGFDVVVDSDYYYNIGSKNKKFERANNASNYTKATVVLANPTVPGTTNVVKVVDNNSSHIDESVGIRTNMTNNTYIVFYTVE